MPVPRYTDEQRRAAFWAKVEKNGPTQPHMDTPCWIWTAATNRAGYGVFGRGGGGNGYIRSHRWSLAQSGVEVPAHLCVLHRCDNPPCVNPDHLTVGTRRDNTRDMVAKGRGRNGLTKGAANKAAKLTEDDVREIRRRWAAGNDYKTDLGREFGVSDAQVGNIVRRKSWTHIP